MIWHGRSISFMKNSFNCSINDPYLMPELPCMAKMSIKFSNLVRRFLGMTGDRTYKTTERSVEIPLALDFISNSLKGEAFLELGCVLPYYIFTEPTHKVYDLSDPHCDCQKRDLRFLSKEELSSNIVSISTVEHISQDEYGIPSNSVSALDVVMGILNNSRKFFVTFPLGVNTLLDKYFVEGGSPYATFVARCKENPLEWEVCGRKALTKECATYGTFCAANTVCILTNCDD